MTIVKAKGSPYICGGYTSVAWDSDSKFKEDANAFIFSLVNGDKTPTKIKVSKLEKAIYSGPSIGSYLGYDIMIKEYSNITYDSYSNLGHSYTHPQYSRAIA